MFFKIVVGLAMVAGVYWGWKLFSRTSYESASYSLIQQDGSFEIREYPELVLASTRMNYRDRGNDGSFGRLFGYISGSNDSKQKIAMTTPVFMEPGGSTQTGEMSFVLPSKFSTSAAPLPTNDSVEITRRPAGKYAVVRFAGFLNGKTTAEQETSLREWMEQNGLRGTSEAESAGYDPPITPGFLRRNEVLIRLAD